LAVLPNDARRTRRHRALDGFPPPQTKIQPQWPFVLQLCSFAGAQPPIPTAAMSATFPRTKSPCRVWCVVDVRICNPKRSPAALGETLLESSRLLAALPVRARPRAAVRFVSPPNRPVPLLALRWIRRVRVMQMRRRLALASVLASLSPRELARVEPWGHETLSVRNVISSYAERSSGIVSADSRPPQAAVFSTGLLNSRCGALVLPIFCRTIL